MADWTNLPDTTFEPGAPAKGRDMRFMRDNPIAIAEGASGAPRIDGTQSPALRNGGVPNGELGAEKFQSGTTERDWVLARCAAASYGAVGTYGFFSSNGATTTNFDPGSTYSGSSLRASGANSAAANDITFSQGGTPSGTWRAMGAATRGVDVPYQKVTLFLRIS